MKLGPSSRRKALVAAVGLGLAALVVLAAVVLARTWLFVPARVPAGSPADFVWNEQAAVERFAGALRFPTVSQDETTPENQEAFAGLIDYLQASFPEVHAALRREVIGDSLLYTWPGQDAGLDPILLASHLDVVPAEVVPEAIEPPPAEMLQRMARDAPSSEPAEDGSTDRSPAEPSEPGARSVNGWTQPPFGGVIDEGFIWGRGALDDKLGVVGILEAVEGLLADGFQPRRTVLIAFGEDEEIGGHRGAQTLARRLQERGVRIAFALDEGTPIVSGIVPGVDDPVALLGVAEKGYVSLELTVQAEGGHSSSPPSRTAIGQLSRAVVRLEANPFPARLDGVAEQFFERVGPEMSFSRRLVFANLWLLRPVAVRALARSPATSPAVRTTTAVTRIRGGSEENVLPRQARAVVNLRLLPGDTVQQALERVRAVIDDERVEVRFLNESEALEASAVSGVEVSAYRLVERTIRTTFPEAIVAPFLVTAGTDARFYEGVSDHVYRFLPVTLTLRDTTRIHGVDERIAISDYERVVMFYAQLIRGLDDFEP